MQIIWDPNKAEINFKKHGVRFSDAELVLYDPFALTLEEQVRDGEQRFVTVGTDAVGRSGGCLFLSCRYHALDFSQKGDSIAKETI